MKPAAFLVLLLGMLSGLSAADAPVSTSADIMLSRYFQRETERLEKECLAQISSLEDWKTKREGYREQLQEMLGLRPMPEKTDLKPMITGRVEREDFTVENLQFQSMPGLYITANLYLPAKATRPSPAILYVCGHGPVITNGVSYGNKVTYQHHGEWFARNGYVCLVLDTIQLGELLGVHHGTYREGMWWWNARGYTPAGVEAWNGIRALDYLATRPEVDSSRFGVTGRSGGGAYSWWIAALDERVKVAAPVAGITDLRNHVLDGVVEGHCDCMFMVNTYRWDYAQVAALVAPRPLLIVNTDNDSIFPLDGVQRVHRKVRAIYDLYRFNSHLGLVIGPGPHKDTQDLQMPVFRWFNRFLKNEDPAIEMAAVKLLKPEQLKVFKSPPAIFRTTNIHDTFVATAPEPSVPQSAPDWQQQRERWVQELKKRTFAAWPATNPPLRMQKAFAATREGLRFEAWDFQSQPEVPLRLYLLEATGWAMPERIEFRLLEPKSPPPALALQNLSFPDWVATLERYFGEELKQERALLEKDRTRLNIPASWNELLYTNHATMVFLAPRGIGLGAWSGNEKKQAQLRRRFMLLGQTLDGMRVWDVRRGIQALRSLPTYKRVPLWFSAEGNSASYALLATMFHPTVKRLELHGLPETFQKGPDYLNILQTLDVPEVAAMVSEKTSLRLHGTSEVNWLYPRKVIASLGWKPEQFAAD